MENTAFAQPLIGLNRVAAQNTWSVLSLLQSQTERVTHAILEQGNKTAAEGQRVLNEWIEEYKRGQTAVKNAVEENFVLLEGLFPKTEEATNKKFRKNNG